ncbi:alpha/beta hydrolase [Paucibacter sp. APW11]|uniref:Alpha/beta hydrolase n=1 Tax=Roseateles aquae TaxID=3077235 RepID=A0ABU3PFY4_9BURK|nr:alpha/beta hydrolase [Paucibacter sp. APW11]MDT9001072.1 alpha/beta hydrolase [Paucibacter sp. APW11]
MMLAANHAATLRLADGRQLSYQQYGLAGGRPVHFFHGFPSSRLLAALVHEQALRAGVCLIAADRPGFGLSSPAPGRSLLSWADDVVALADHLGHQRFEVVGVSCGGAYALACAHALPQRISRLALLAGMGPMDLPQIRREQMPALKLMFGLARLQPWLIAPLLALDRKLYRGSPERALKLVAGMLSAPDQALLRAEPGLAAGFIASMAEAYRQGIGAAMAEAALIAGPRGFELQQIRQTVHIHQGAFDRHVPPAMGRYLAAQLPAARLFEYADEGHLSIMSRRFEASLRALADLDDPALTQ